MELPSSRTDSLSTFAWWSFFADRENSRSERLHDRLQGRSSTGLSDVRRRRVEPHEAGPYRVVGDVNPREFPDDEYPATAARIEAGFQLQTGDPYESYWCNWIEPEGCLLVG